MKILIDTPAAGRLTLLEERFSYVRSRTRAAAGISLLSISLEPHLARALILIEAKSGATVADDFFAGLDSFAKLVARIEPHRTIQKVSVFGGVGRLRSTGLTWSPGVRFMASLGRTKAARSRTAPKKGHVEFHCGLLSTFTFGAKMRRRSRPSS